MTTSASPRTGSAGGASMAPLRDFILDLFPLTKPVVNENRVIGEELQRTALQLCVETVGRGTWPPTVLVEIARDLGYMDEDVVRYLLQQLKQLTLAERVVRRAGRVTRAAGDMRSDSRLRDSWSF